MRHRKISTQIWADSWFMSLSSPKPSGKWLWVYLLTGPHTKSTPGLSVVGLAELAERLNWTPKSINAVLKELGFLKTGKFSDDVFEKQGQEMSQSRIIFDTNTMVLCIAGAIKHNVPSSIPALKLWLEDLKEIPECRVKSYWLKCLVNYISSEDFLDFLSSRRLKRDASEHLKLLKPRARMSEVPRGLVGTRSPDIPPPPGDPLSRSRSRSRSMCVNEKETIKNTKQVTSTHTPPPPQVHPQTPTRTFSRPADRRDLDPEMLEITSTHAQLWALEGPQTPSGDDRFRIQQAVLEHGLDACRQAVRGHYLDRKRAETTKFSEVWWAFPAETIHGKRDTRKLSTGKFLAFAQAGKPRRKQQDNKPCQDEPERVFTPEEQKENIKKAKAMLAGIFGEEKK